MRGGGSAAVAVVICRALLLSAGASPAIGGVFARLREPPRALQRIAQDVLDLRVDRTEIVVRPALYGVEQRRFEAKEERLARGHGAR